jgi:NAD(P)-dependent dehydrogenase (short-subunit alcohol dehydrogenase family)
MSHIKVAAMDLGIARSIDAFCQRIVDEGKPISILINRAGIMATPLQRDADGHEAQFAINDLGHYRLTCGLWPALRGGGKARVVAVSSRAHQLAGIDFDDIDFTSRPYDKWLAYGQSKTANVLFAVELDRRGRDHGVRAFSLHPGQILTNLARHLSTEEMASFDAVDEHGRPRLDPDKGLKHVEQGAATSLWCATNPSLAGLGGVYCEDCDIASIHSDQTGRKGVSPWAIDEGNASRLWSVSERLTGLTAG